MFHRLLAHQLRKLDLDKTIPPNAEAWQRFLERVNRAYIEGDQDRDLLERSLTISSGEMQALNESLQKSSESRLAEERDKLQAVISSLGEGLCILDQDGSLRFINPEGERLLGWQEGEFIGQAVLGLVGVWDRSKQPGIINGSSLQTLIGSGQAYRNEDGYLLQKDGMAFPASYVLNPMRRDGALLGAVFVFRDITHRKQIEEKLAKRAAEFETIAQVSLATSTILEGDKLLQEVVDLTKSSFKLYHAHIYLLNEAGDALNLAAGAGEVGRQMVAQHWSIPLVHEHSLVAKVARTRQVVMVNDVGENPDFLPNPLLLHTRSELVVPMIVGDRVVGVLDVQSDEMGHFTEEDVRIQTTLAAQVAVALQNARSFAEQQQSGFLLSKRVRELNCLNEIGREIAETPPVSELLQWVTERIPPAMQYPELSVAAIEYDGQIYGVPEAIGLPCQIVHALRIGAEVMGRIYISYTDKHDFLDEESALIGGIAGRVGSYIESRRLLEQIQQRALEFEEASSFLDSIIENIPILITVKDAQDLRFVRWNKYGEKLVGVDRKDMVGKTDHDFFPKEEADFFTAKDREVLTSGKWLDIPEEPIQNAAGEIRLLHTQKVPIYGPDGKPKYLLAMAEDITERKRAEEVLRENEALYQSLIDALPQNVYRIDRKGRVTFGNKAYLANLGMTLDECRGKTVHDFFPKELADKYEADDEEVMQRGEIIDIVESYKSPIANEITYVQTVKVPIRDFSGQVIGIQGIYWDITQSKRSELALTKRAVELETVARVGIAASTILEIDKLLQEVVDLTKSSFGLYHAHVYLLNSTGKTLVLAAGAGEVGRQMVNKGWSIPLEREQSLVAQAARTRQAVIVNDVHQEPNFLPNPLLPEAQAEMVVPLIVSDQLLGVLDVQADRVDRFTEEDMRLKTILAGQIAAALQNARSFAEQQRATLLLSERVKELNCLNEIGREIVEAPPIPELLQWVAERIPPAMQYPELGVVAIEYDGQIYGVSEAIALPYQLGQALHIGGEVMGRITMAYTEKHDFLDEESALIGGIAGRVNGYIESRRLFEQTQEAQAGLVQQKEFFSKVINSIPVGLFAKDVQNDYRFSLWNTKMEELFGVKREDMLGKTDYDYSEKEIADDYRKIDIAAIEAGEIIDIPVEEITTSQGVRLAHTTKLPIYDSAGKPEILLVVLEDITERRQAEAERERLLAEVEATYRQYVRREWEHVLSEQHQGNWHIEYQPNVERSNVQRLTSDEALAEVQNEVIREGKTKVIVGTSGNGHEVEPSLVAPIALRGQVIGALSLQDVALERQWTDEEMALVETVSEQLALTLENLRLIEESQRNAWRDQVVSESTAKVWSSSEIEEVMKAAVAQLGDKLRASEVVIRLGTEKELAQE